MLFFVMKCPLYSWNGNFSSIMHYFWPTINNPPPRMKDRQINVVSLRFVDTNLEGHFSSEKEKRSGAAFCCCVLVLFFITAMEVFIDPLWVVFCLAFVRASLWRTPSVFVIQMRYLCYSHPAWRWTMWLLRSERYCCWFSPCAPWLPLSPGWEKELQPYSVTLLIDCLYSIEEATSVFVTVSLLVCVFALEVPQKAGGVLCVDRPHALGQKHMGHGCHIRPHHDGDCRHGESRRTRFHSQSCMVFKTDSVKLWIFPLWD